MTRAAIENLRENQRQLDMDGCEVAVSRQAVEETHIARQRAVISTLCEKARAELEQAEPRHAEASA